MPTLRQAIEGQKTAVAQAAKVLQRLHGFKDIEQGVAAERSKIAEAGALILDALLYDVDCSIRELGLTDPAELRNLVAVSLPVSQLSGAMTLALAEALVRLQAHGDHGDELAVDRAKRLIEKRLKERLWGPETPGQ